MKWLLRSLLLLAFAAWPAWGQFQLYLVNGSVVQPIVHTYDLGNVAPGTSVSVPLQITNISNSPAILNLLTITGSGFSIPTANLPALPASLNAQQSINFTVVFQAGVPGLYSATLNSVGITVTLTTTVPTELTYEWVTGSTVQLLSAGPVNFGSVPVGQSPTIEVIILNQTTAPLSVPTVTLAGAGFSLASKPAAVLIQPAGSTDFELQFSPTAAGASTATLTIGSSSFTVTGTGVVPPLPAPSIVLTLAQAQSAQQGSVAVNFSTTSQTSTTGTVTLSFAPNVPTSGASDAGIVFASGGQSATFSVFIGQTHALFGTASSLAFQTGTTAGTITITATIGNNTTQQSITIVPAVVDLTAAQGTRATGSIEVDLTGFDNTRTAGALSFAFFDASGNAIGSPIQANGSSQFAAYFQNAVGGSFELKAVFPVQGDTSQIAAFQATITNSAGAATTARTNF